MKIENLPFLLTVRDCKSISSAARRLHIKQTTLSSIIASIEKELGCTIFVRTPSGVAATPKGEEILDHIWELNIHYQNLMNLQPVPDNLPEFFKIQFPPIIPSSIEQKLYEYYDMYQLKVNLCFEHDVSIRIPENLAQNRIHAGLTFLSPSEFSSLESLSAANHFMTTHLFDDEMRCIVSKNNPIASMNAVHLNEIGHNLVLPYPNSKGSWFMQRQSEYFHNVSVVPDLENMLTAVSENNFCSILPWKILEFGNELERRGLTAVPIANANEELTLHVILFTRSSDIIGPQEYTIQASIISCFEDFIRS